MLSSFVIQTIVIFDNDLSVSYFTYQDEYFTLYYIKPYARIAAFLIGAICGANYYSYQFEFENPSKFSNFLTKLVDKKVLVTFLQVFGFLMMLSMVILMQIINNAPNQQSDVVNFLYLTLSRPIFIIGFSMNTFPLIIGAKACKPILRFLNHPFWVPVSRLTYGAYLSHGIFMVFREYNTERGEWASSFDAFLFFFAYVTFSFAFSLVMNILLDLPCNSLIHEFSSKKGSSASNEHERGVAKNASKK